MKQSIASSNVNRRFRRNPARYANSICRDAMHRISTYHAGIAALLVEQWQTNCRITKTKPPIHYHKDFCLSSYASCMSSDAACVMSEGLCREGKALCMSCRSIVSHAGAIVCYAGGIVLHVKCYVFAMPQASAFTF